MARILLLILIFAAGVEAQRRRQTGLPSANGGVYDLPAVTFRGTLKDITSKAIFIEQEDGQPTTIYRNHKTKFVRENKSVDPKSITIGAQLTLDVAKNPDGSLLAVNVMVAK